MEFVFKKIKKIITPQLCEELSMRLMIDETTFIKLSDPIIAGLFGALLVKGDNLETEKMLMTFVSEVKDDREPGIYFLEDGVESKRIEATIALGDAILFGKREEFASFLSELTVVDKIQIDKLMNALIYTFGLDLGRKLMTGSFTITGLMGQIHAERNFFLGYISSGISSILGLPSLLTIGQNLSSDAKVVSDMVYHEIMYNNTSTREKKNNWWKKLFFKVAIF